MSTVLIRLKIKDGMEKRYEEIQKALYEQTHRLEKVSFGTKHGDAKTQEFIIAYWLLLITTHS